MQYFVRFCEVVIKEPTIREIRSVTSVDGQTEVAGLHEKLEELKHSLVERDAKLEVRVNDKMHDREIKIDNGWVIKIGRGLDFYQKPDFWFGVGANDLSIRPCLETKVDIFKSQDLN